MARRGIHRLSPAQVKNAKPGTYADGGGLWLRVKPAADGTPSRSWVFRYARHGCEHNVGLGPVHTIGLAEARDAAADARKLLLVGEDPLAHKRTRLAAQRVAAVPTVTFRQAAQRYIDSHEAGWTPGHSRAWRDTLNHFVHPAIGHFLVQDVDTPAVLRALHPIWEHKTATANRVRGRIEAVLNSCKARGEVSGDNPAAWSVLKHLLPSPSKLNGKDHLAALPFEEMPQFMARLARLDGPAGRALEFAILTAARSGEVRHATWDEIDLDWATWVIPASRMKAGREHVVPLCRRAVEILREAKELRRNELIFSLRRGPLAMAGLRRVLERLGQDVTVHGFRSSFRDWCGAMTSYPREIAEMALAHRIGDASEQAYARTDYLAKRKRLMESWCEFCRSNKTVGDVVPLRA
jgi:integrase